MWAPITRLNYEEYKWVMMIFWKSLSSNKSNWFKWCWHTSWCHRFPQWMKALWVLGLICCAHNSRLNSFQRFSMISHVITMILIHWYHLEAIFIQPETLHKRITIRLRSDLYTHIILSSTSTNNPVAVPKWPKNMLLWAEFCILWNYFVTRTNIMMEHATFWLYPHC